MTALSLRYLDAPAAAALGRALDSADDGPRWWLAAGEGAARGGLCFGWASSPGVARGKTSALLPGLVAAVWAPIADGYSIDGATTSAPGWQRSWSDSEFPEYVGTPEAALYAAVNRGACVFMHHREYGGWLTGRVGREKLRWTAV